jgi:ankyrin repeat protein
VERIFEAVLASDSDVTLVLRSVPLAAESRMSEDILVPSIHWLYAGDTALHLAAAAFRPYAVTALLQSGADPRARNRRKATPLHYACDAQPIPDGPWNPAAQVEVIDALVSRGAGLDDSDAGGATPLHRAVRSRSAAAVGRLLALGARTDCRLRAPGSTALHLAVRSTGAGGTAGTTEAQLDIISLLVGAGADADAKDASGRTARASVRNERAAAALAGRQL